MGGGGNADDVQGASVRQGLVLEDLVGSINAAFVLGVDGVFCRFFIGHFGKDDGVLADEAAILVGMGGEGGRPYQGAVLKGVHGSVEDLVSLPEGLRDPDDLLQVPDTLVFGLDLFHGVLGIALAALGVLHGNEHALAVELAVAAFGDHVGADEIVHAQFNRHVYTGTPGDLLGILMLVVVGVVAPVGVYAQEVALVVHHDVGSVVADGHAPVVEGVEANVEAEFVLVLYADISHAVDHGVGDVETGSRQGGFGLFDGDTAGAVYMDVDMA